MNFVNVYATATNPSYSVNLGSNTSLEACCGDAGASPIPYLEWDKTTCLSPNTNCTGYSIEVYCSGTWGNDTVSNQLVDSGPLPSTSSGVSLPFQLQSYGSGATINYNITITAKIYDAGNALIGTDSYNFSGSIYNDVTLSYNTLDGFGGSGSSLTVKCHEDDNTIPYGSARIYITDSYIYAYCSADGGLYGSAYLQDMDTVTLNGYAKTGDYFEVPCSVAETGTGLLIYGDTNFSVGIGPCSLSGPINGSSTVTWSFACNNCDDCNCTVANAYYDWAWLIAGGTPNPAGNAPLPLTSSSLCSWTYSDPNAGGATRTISISRNIDLTWNISFSSISNANPSCYVQMSAVNLVAGTFTCSGGVLSGTYTQDGTCTCCGGDTPIVEIQL